MTTKPLVIPHDIGTTVKSLTENTRDERVRYNRDFRNTGWITQINEANIDVPSLCGNRQQGVFEGGESDV